jgi:hypothetical protein
LRDFLERLMVRSSERIAFHDLLQSMLEEAWAGLSKPQKELARFLRCARLRAVRGDLQSPEYYPTRRSSRSGGSMSAMAGLLGRER